MYKVDFYIDKFNLLIVYLFGSEWWIICKYCVFVLCVVRLLNMGNCCLGWIEWEIERNGKDYILCLKIKIVEIIVYSSIVRMCGF